MGARQRAQHRGKNKRGSEKGSPYSQKNSSSSLQVPSLDPSHRSRALQGWHQFARSGSASNSASGYGTPRNTFSMMQEARNTDRHAFGWGAARLRDNSITFVSGGTLAREELPDRQHQSSSSSEEEDEYTYEDEPVEDDTIREADMAQATTEIMKATESIHITEPLLSSAHEKGREDEMSSDDDKLLFKGRNALAPKPTAASPINEAKEKGVVQLPKPVPAPTNRDLPNTNGINASQQAASGVTSQTIQDAAEDPGPFLATVKMPPQPQSETPQLSTSSDIANSSSRHRAVNSRYRKGWRARKQTEEDEEEAIIQDYIANMAKDDDEDEDKDEAGNKPHRRNEHIRFYDGAAEKHVKVQTTSTRNRKARAPEQAVDWSSADLEDFDDLSTTDEEILDIGQVLRHRERVTGSQYLVTAIGESTSDAKWMLHSKLTSPTAVNEIQVYEEIRAMPIEIDSEDSESMSSSEEEALGDLNEDIESEMEENTRIFKHTQRMTDEQIARALAKQEELGMGGDEVMLFDGQGMDESEDEVFANGDSFIPFSTGKHTSNRGRSKRNRRQRDSFPSAEAFADALEQDPYGAFDVMDFDRPSLRLKRKGRQSYPFDLDIEDEELEQQLVSTWMKDREKKAARKREKMEARAAELFEAGERSDPAAIKAEIRRFLVEDDDTLDLAPMDAHLRASVHRLAKSLKLNSRSHGKEGQGAGRYPVLTKTLNTPQYTVDNVWEIDALMNMRKFFPKHGGGSYKGPKATKVPGAKKGRGGFAAASYANGEVVGAAAPELGADNRGRAMLERMGWSSGMGIGKEGNEGGLEAIKHVVKTNKAGLG